MAVREVITRPWNWVAGAAIGVVFIVEAYFWLPTLYAEMVQWQTGIAAVLGFGGLIAAAVVGFHNLIDAQKHQAELARERNDDLARRERERDEERKARERFEMASMLRAEISTVTALLARPRSIITKLKSLSVTREITFSETGFQALLNFPAPTLVLERLVERLGDITPGVATAIFAWYQMVEQLRWVPSTIRPRDGEVTLSTEDIEFIFGVIDSLDSFAETALERLSHDLDDLASRYGWPSPATDPAADLAAARRLLEKAADLPGEDE